MAEVKFTIRQQSRGFMGVACVAMNAAVQIKDCFNPEFDQLRIDVMKGNGLTDKECADILAASPEEILAMENSNR